MFEAMAIANAIKNFPKYEGSRSRRRGLANPGFESENASSRLDTIVNEQRPLIEAVHGKKKSNGDIFVEWWIKICVF